MPMRAEAMAASHPAWPAPTTTTSNCSVNCIRRTEISNSIRRMKAILSLILTTRVILLPITLQGLVPRAPDRAGGEANMVLTGALAGEVVRLNAPGQIVLEGIVHSTAES